MTKVICGVCKETFKNWKELDKHVIMIEKHIEYKERLRIEVDKFIKESKKVRKLKSKIREE